MTQGGLPYDGRAPRVRGSDTSAAAADSIDAVTMRGKVLRLFVVAGRHGCTDDEVEKHFGMRHQTASARRRELELEGRVRLTAARRKTRSGRTAGVYVVVVP